MLHRIDGTVLVKDLEGFVVVLTDNVRLFALKIGPCIGRDSNRGSSGDSSAALLQH